MRESASTFIYRRFDLQHDLPAPVLPLGFTMRSYDQIQRVDLDVVVSGICLRVENEILI